MFSSEKKVVDLKDKQIRQAKSLKNVSVNKYHSKVQGSTIKSKVLDVKEKKKKIKLLKVHMYETQKYKIMTKKKITNIKKIKNSSQSIIQ